LLLQVLNFLVLFFNYLSIWWINVTFLNGLTAVYYESLDVDECVFVSESIIWFIWFMMSWVAIIYVFWKKWGSLWSFVCWYSQIMEMLLSLEVVNLTNVPTTWLDWNVCLSCLKQWPSDLPMESYIFLLSFFKYEKNVLFENKCLFKYFK